MLHPTLPGQPLSASELARAPGAASYRSARRANPDLLIINASGSACDRYVAYRSHYGKPQIALCVASVSKFIRASIVTFSSTSNDVVTFGALA